MPTLLEVLTRRNPEFIEMLDGGGSLTTNHLYPPVAGKEDWKDFSYKSLMQMFKSVLTAELPQDIIEPLEPEGPNKEDWGEESTHSFFTQTLFKVVNEALKHAWMLLHNSSEPPQIGTGDKAKCTNQTDDSRFSPDLAIVQPSRKQFLSFKYENLVPGDVKEAKRWNRELEKKDPPKYNLVFRQIQQYSKQTQQRYGIIITGRELVLVRCRLEKIESGIGADRARREPRNPPRNHTRNPSDMTEMSSLSSGFEQMSVSGTSYNDDMTNIEFAPLQRVHIPYSAYGPGKLTVRLALWGMCMLAAAPGTSTLLQTEYAYDLHSCMQAQGGFFHLSTGAFTSQMPDGAQLIDAPKNLVVANNHSFSAELVRTAEQHSSGAGLIVTPKDVTLPRLVVGEANRFWSRVKQQWYRMVLADGKVIWEELDR
ncbi:hypothetical protein ASPFODRAFT_62918 [Aspergillus luchuensis CBS 106.47]|uniref:Uncharacterized protein n=1 Tax=Aspergillus luchuensis (strain CBS 106.47) TaxID=1137211 RepID=A0A1M3TAL9_ASPLC|nr:hypothetical protein ASPFODRAFT_62918 [Aspergillus luchuensis CBS 106.47]